jgi:cytochrome oxidase Cu insertion factor (SCO1/SenC/PrrC family)
MTSRSLIRLVSAVGLLVLSTPELAAGPSDQAGLRTSSSDLAFLLRPTMESRPRRDQRGEHPTVETLRDHLVIVSFVSSDRTIVCAVRTLELDKLARSLPENLPERVSFLALDTAPAGDDASPWRHFADGLVGPTTPLRFLDSDAASTAAIAARLRYPASALPERHRAGGFDRAEPHHAQLQRHAAPYSGGLLAGRSDGDAPAAGLGRGRTARLLPTRCGRSEGRALAGGDRGGRQRRRAPAITRPRSSATRAAEPAAARARATAPRMAAGPGVAQTPAGTPAEAPGQAPR